MSHIEHEAAFETIKRGKYGAVRVTLGPLGWFLAVVGLGNAASLGFSVALYGKAQSHGPIAASELAGLMLGQGFGLATALAVGALTLLYRANRRSE